MPETAGSGEDPTLRPIMNIIHSLNGEQIEVTAEETVSPETVQTIYADCKARYVQEVEQGISNLREQIAGGQPPDIRAHQMGYILLDKARQAIAVGDHVSFATYRDMVMKIPNTSARLMADVCFAGIQIADQRSFDILTKKLQEEKEAQDKPGKKPMSNLLDEVLDRCAETDTPPDTWIRDYGVDGHHQWELYTQHYKYRAARSEGEERDAHQAKINALAEQLINDSFSPEFTFTQVWATLHKVTDPELRARLVQGFRKCGDSVQLTNHTFQMMNWMGQEILEDPELANQDNIGYFTEAVESCAERLLEAGMPAYDLIYAQLGWRTALARYNGASPQELVDLINLQTSEMLSSDIPDESGPGGKDGMRNRDYVAAYREHRMRGHAQAYAKQGDFASARLFLSNITSEGVQLSTINKCLEAATTREQIDAIRPDELTLMYNPALELYTRFAEAKVAGNAEDLAAIALEYAQNIEQGGVLAHKRIKEAYQLLSKHDSPNAIPLARELLSVLRQAGELPFEIAYLSKALIKVGDPDEPQNAKAHIERLATNDAERLYDTWQLSKVL